MDQNLVEQNICLILTIWSIVYLGDYYLTVLAARNYRAHFQKYVIYEGSYAITPQFQKDIDRLRIFSPQILFRWLLSIPMIFILWLLSIQVLA